MDDRAFGADEVAGPYNRPKLRKLRFLMTGNSYLGHYDEARLQYDRAPGPAQSRRRAGLQ